MLTGQNGTWNLQSPVNNPIENVTCQWYVDTISNTHWGGHSTCGADVSDWYCCNGRNPCLVGEGDCYGDSDCGTGLICGTDNCGPAYPFQFDCCEVPDQDNSSDVVINIAMQTYVVSVPYYNFILHIALYMCSFRRHQAP